MFHRIVHLDLKGAPWRITYLEKIIPLFKKWGATGVLLEWEDTFPYTDELGAIGSLGRSMGEHLYNHNEVAFILRCIKDHGLEPIQLFQTIGHMEFVLKHAQFAHLREVPRSACVLCPTQNDSLVLCKNMALQLLKAQPEARFIHIGGDEAWHMNICTNCQLKSNSHVHKVASLYLDHIKAIAAFIKDNFNVTVLMWDDMMRSVDLDTLKAYNLGSYVQPVVWNYNTQLQIDASLWDKYSKIFPEVWAASAFKGANGSSQIVCYMPRYASNQTAWLQEIDNYKEKINFVGIILTGWSRYDHYATLCELLPVSLPSLALYLNIWTHRDLQLPMSTIQEWPGRELAETITAFTELRDKCRVFLHGDQVETWLNDWQIEKNHVSVLQVENIAATAQHLKQEVSTYITILSTLLRQYTTEGSADEWVQSRARSIHARLCRLHARAVGVITWFIMVNPGVLCCRNFRIPIILKTKDEVQHFAAY